MSFDRKNGSVYFAVVAQILMSANNIDATEKLRVNLVDLGARITSDIEVNSKAFQTFTEEMIKQSQLTMQNHHALFQETGIGLQNRNFESL